MRVFNPRYLLSALIFFGVLTLGLRIDQVWQTAASGKPFGAAHAQENKTDGAPAVTTPAPAAGTDKPTDAKADTKPEAKSETKSEAKSGADISVPSMPAPDASAEEETSPAEMEVLKQLSNRRDELDKRAHALDTREAMIKVGEQRVDQKIKEMQSLRLQLQSMVDQINGAQQTQLDNLVKIYETMKPADAAKIFESLDMPILIGVIQRMKPKSTAPIMAAMAPEKAKELTVALTKETQLPQGK